MTIYRVYEFIGSKYEFEYEIGCDPTSDYLSIWFHKGWSLSIMPYHTKIEFAEEDNRGCSLLKSDGTEFNEKAIKKAAFNFAKFVHDRVSRFNPNFLHCFFTFTSDWKIINYENIQGKSKEFIKEYNKIIPIVLLLS